MSAGLINDYDKIEMTAHREALPYETGGRKYASLMPCLICGAGGKKERSLTKLL